MQVRAQRVLVFGDSLSHVGPDAGPEAVEISPHGSYSTPGAVMAHWLLGAGAAAARVDARVGRSAINFFGRERAAELLALDLAWKPDLVIVMLGTNDLGMAKTSDLAAMIKLRAALGSRGAKVIAIGPPSFPAASNESRRPAVLATLQAAFGDGAVIDAGPLTPTDQGARTRDGVHFSADGGRKFGAALASAVLALGGHDLAVLAPGRLLKAGIGVAGFGALLALAWIVGRRRRQMAGWVPAAPVPERP